MTHVRKAQAETRDKWAYQPYLVGIAREALEYSDQEYSPSPVQLDPAELPLEVRAAVENFAQKAVVSTVAMSGIPQVVPANDHERSFAEVRSEFREKLDEKLDYLEANRSTPMIRRAIKMEFRTPHYRRGIRKRYTRGELSDSELRRDRKWHEEQKRRILALKRSIE
jgi:hypothetical protein